MSDKKNRKFFRFSWEELNLECQWHDCKVVLDQMPTFLDHIEDHLKQVQEGDNECKWEDCGMSWTSFQELYCHVFYHAFHTKLKCYGMNFLKRKKMPECTLESQGRNVIPDIPSNLICYWENCEVIYHNPEVFYRHVDIHVEDYPKGKKLQEPIKCMWQGCSSTFGSQYKLKDHLRTHTQEKMLACPTCGGMFASRTKFVDHIDRQAIVVGEKETDATVLNCAYCGSQFPTERLLKDHMRNHVNQYKCPYCDLTCSSLSALKIHITYRHSDYKPLVCEYCDYRCKRNHDLRRHLEIHSSEPSYHCPAEDCDQSFKTHSSFATHFRRCHEGEAKPIYVCHLCEKSFSRGYYLTKHLVRKHQFKCPSGLRRFKYERDADGFYKLRMLRYESIEVTETMIKYDDGDKQIIDAVVKEPKDIVDGDTSEAMSVPLVMYVPDSANAGEGMTREKALESVAGDPVLLEIHGSNGNTLLTSNGAAVVYLHSGANPQPNSGQKTVQIINHDNEGRTIVQTAVVLAEGGEADSCMLSAPLCNSATQ